jgi:hypothetical protein
LVVFISAFMAFASFSKSGKRHHAGAAVGRANGSRGEFRQANPAICGRVK